MKNVILTGAQPPSVIPTGAQRSGGISAPERPDTPTTTRPLPPGWRWARLGDVTNVIMGQSPPGHTYNKEGVGTPFFQGKVDFQEVHPIPATWCTEPTRLAEAGDILISVRAPVGPTNVADQTCCIGRGLAAIRPAAETDGWFVLHFLRLIEPKLAETGQGSTFDAVNRDVLEALPIPLPPLPEQRRIAAILREALDAVRRAREAALARLEAARALPAAFLRSVFDSEEAQQWPEVNLGQVCERAQYGHTASATSNPLGPHFLRITDIQNGRVAWDTVPFCRCDPRDVPKYALKNGDILIARTGGTTGKSFLIEDPPEAVFASYLIRVRVRDGNDPRFVYAFLQSDRYWNQIGAGMRGGAQPNVNARMLEALTLRCPEPDQQTAAAGRLEADFQRVEGVRAVVEAELAAIDALPQSLLRQAFAGEL